MKYLNNRLECDHGKLKRLIRPTLGFQSMKTAYGTIKGFEVMRMFKKGQFTTWIDAAGGGAEARFINRLFRPVRVSGRRDHFARPDQGLQRCRARPLTGDAGCSGRSPCPPTNSTRPFQVKHQFCCGQRGRKEG